jgi:hypothetical protein
MHVVELHLLQRHHDLPEVLVGFHAVERRADVVEFVDLVDRQLHLARLYGRPDVFPHLFKNLADFLDGAGAEGDADIVDAARGVQVEVEIGVGAAGRPTLTMRPLILVAARFWLATLPDT